MDDGTKWLLTIDLLDATKKKEVSRSLSFRTREVAESEVKKFTESKSNGTTAIFRIVNEDGEYQEFRGCDWQRHSLKKEFVGIF
jgi:hypothetical protein